MTYLIQMTVFDGIKLFRKEDHLHVRRVEVHLAELEYYNVVPILADWDVVSEGVMMIALGLVQYLIHVGDTPYDQLLTVIGGRADLSREGVLGVMYPIAVRVRLATRVNRVYHLETVGAGDEHAEQEQQEDRETIGPRWQHSHGSRVIRGSKIRFNSFLGRGTARS